MASSILFVWAFDDLWSHVIFLWFVIIWIVLGPFSSLGFVPECRLSKQSKRGSNAGKPMSTQKYTFMQTQVESSDVTKPPKTNGPKSNLLGQPKRGACRLDMKNAGLRNPHHWYGPSWWKKKWKREKGNPHPTPNMCLQARTLKGPIRLYRAYTALLGPMQKKQKQNTPKAGQESACLLDELRRVSTC